MMQATLTINPPKLHGGQVQVWRSPARFNVMACGRRWGKSRLGALMCVFVGSQSMRAWWVAPTYPMASIGWRMIKRLAIQIPGAQIRESERMVAFTGGGSIQVRSADNPDSLRGEGLDFLVMDECAFMQEAAWTEALRPTLADRKGRALFISTPKGRNWFWRIWSNADGGEWRRWKFTSYDNPFIQATEIDAAKATLPERSFSQEFMAEFVEDGGAVFRRITECATSTPLQSHLLGHTMIAGLDWALSYDYTALSIIDATTRRLVHIERFNGVDYAMQRERIKATCERFKVSGIVAEENAMGKPNNDELRRAGLPVRDFTTTNASKAEIIESLASAFENGAIAILPDETLITELQSYEMERLPGGSVRYSAPQGMHDDMTMSLAFAWHGAQTGQKRRATSKEY